MHAFFPLKLTLIAKVSLKKVITTSLSFDRVLNVFSKCVIIFSKIKTITEKSFCRLETIKEKLRGKTLS